MNGSLSCVDYEHGMRLRSSFTGHEPDIFVVPLSKTFSTAVNVGIGVVNISIKILDRI